ncbi:MAG: PAS domain S-box protein [Chloroflexota bacterium]
MIKNVTSAKAGPQPGIVAIGKVLKTLQIEGWLVTLDVALLAAVLLLIFTESKVLFFHLIFVLLTFGAFFWKFHAFALRAILWVAVTAVVVSLTILAGETQVEELIEIPLLTSILILVFAIAHQRSTAEEKLRQSNETLEKRVVERTTELSRLNAELIREITRHKQTEATLRESEERYRRLVELSFEAIAIHNEAELVYINPQGVKLLGAASAAELIGKPIQQFMRRDYLKMIQTQDRQPGEDKGVPLVEEKLTRLDGIGVNVEVTSIPIAYRGRPAVQTVIRDITARKRAEIEREYLLTTEREQRLLAETLGEVFLALTAQTSRQTVLAEILRQVQRLVSYSAANIMLLKAKNLYVAHHHGYDLFNSQEWLANLRQSLDDLPLDAMVVRSKQAVVIADTHQHPDWTYVPESAWIRSFMAVPICLGERVLGLLRLDSDTPGKFSNLDVEHLQPLVNAAAIALENARLYDQARQEIIERSQAEKELRRIAAKNQAMLNAIPDSMFHLSRTGQLLDYKIYGANSSPQILAELGIKDLNETLDQWPDLVDQVLYYIAHTLDTGEMQIFEFQLPLSAGVRDFEARLVVSGPDEVLAIVRDITARKARAAAVEKERARIARDLHDSLGQSLGYLHLKLDEFAGKDIRSEAKSVPQELMQMRDVANEAYELVRSMIAAGRPSNSTDLAEALLAQAKSAGNRARFKVKLSSQGQARPLSPIIQHQILYLFQEALSNVVKHAQARQVDLNLVWTDELLTITLSDDGCGFETNVSRHNGHFGLTIMRERAEEINGFLSINSSPQAGTDLILRLPLASAFPVLPLKDVAPWSLT